MIVKQESIFNFFKDFILEHDRDNRCGCTKTSMMRDKLYAKKNIPINSSDQTIEFILEFDKIHGKVLEYHYKYTVVKYDDVSIELVLEDFTVELISIRQQGL